MDKQKAIIYDLDGTLCDCSLRREFMEQDPPDWKNFFYGIPYDPVHRWCEKLMSGMYTQGYTPVFVSGRPEDYRKDTINWFKENLFYFYFDFKTFGPLFMRASGDHRKDEIVKRELYENHIKDKYDILFVVDDRPSVCRMWRDLGLICLACDEGNF